MVKTVRQSSGALMVDIHVGYIGRNREASLIIKRECLVRLVHSKLLENVNAAGTDACGPAQPV